MPEDQKEIDHVVIAAGGQGARLTSVAGDVPKVLMRVGDKTMLEHQLELAARSGVRSATIFAGYRADKIIAFAGDGSRFGVRLAIASEKEPLGNAGALLQALDTLPEHFFLFYGDVMIGADLQRMATVHREYNADVTLFAHPNDHPHDSDLLETDADGWLTAVHPSPHPPVRYFGNLVNAALYVIRRDALRGLLKPGKYDFAKDVIPALLARGGRVRVYRSGEYLKDIGTPERLQRVNEDWSAGLIANGAQRPAVFLDRDGTLNVEKGFLRSAEDLEIVAGAGRALRSLRRAGFRLVVLTNQPVIARGEASEADVAEIHRRLEWELGKDGAYVDAIYVCPHHPDSGFPGERPALKIVCDCRKPAPGLFERACRDLDIDAAASWMIGDRDSDIEMARRAGIRSVLIRNGGGVIDAQCRPDAIAATLDDAAALILQNQMVKA